MIARLILLLSTIFLSLNNTFADILVQPGYGQPHAATHAPIYNQQPAHQVFRQNPIPLEHYDPELLAQLLYEQDLMHYLAALQPLHVDQAQAAGPTVGFPLLHHPHYPPLLPRLVPRRPHLAKLGGLGFLGPSVLVGHPHVPLAVHHRSRRSIDKESDFGSAKSENDVASKSSLNKQYQTVADSVNQEDKHGEKQEETHQGKTNHATPRATLLGLNPERMILGYPQTQLTDNIEQPGTKRMIGFGAESNKWNPDSDSADRENILAPLLEDQEPPGIKKQRSSDDQAFEGKVKSSRAGCSARAASHDTHESKGNKNQQTPLRVIMSDDEESSSSDDRDSTYVSMPRNFPDPRPISSSSSTSNQKKAHHRDEHRTSGAHNTQRASWNERSGDSSAESDEIVGTSRRKLQRLYGLKHPHKHRTSSLPSYTYYDIRPYESCCSSCATNPEYYVYNTDYGARSGTRMMDPAASSAGQYVQVPTTVQSANYAPNARYVVLPESYSNQAAVPINGYPWSSPYYIRR
ncbi:hypothetical protein KM043_017230 [Ampulex compressa]|nr:hypothetical protein KM043_017230 [Ampulex compressa]